PISTSSARPCGPRGPWPRTTCRRRSWKRCSTASAAGGTPDAEARSGDGPGRLAGRCRSVLVGPAGTGVLAGVAGARGAAVATEQPVTAGPAEEPVTARPGGEDVGPVGATEQVRPEAPVEVVGAVAAVHVVGAVAAVEHVVPEPPGHGVVAGERADRV